jgi:ACT domain-containing protein
VKDYFVVQEKGKWLNAISLGVFKSNEAAQKYLEALHSKNVHSVKVGERKSKLKFTVFLIKDIDAGIKDKLNVLQKDFPDSELKVSACSI